MDAVFCNSLRKKPSLAKVPQILTKADSKWRGRTLESHDLAFPVADQMAAASLFGPCDVGDASSKARTQTRLQRLSLIHGGERAFAIFVLNNNSPAKMREPLDWFMEFQLLTVDVPAVATLPVPSIDQLPATIMTIQQDFVAALLDDEPTRSTNPKDLLAFCTHGPRLSQSHANMMTDLTSSLADAATKAYGPASVESLADYIGEEDARRFVTFFRRNRIV